MKTARSLFTALFLLSGAFHAPAAPILTTDTAPGNEGINTDIFDVAQGNQVIFSFPQYAGLGDSDPRSAFGFASSFVEPPHAIFVDGPPAGTVDFIEWQTPGWIDLNSFELHLQQDGANNPARGAASFALFGSQDGITFTQISGATIPSAGSNDNVPLLITDNALIGATGMRAFRLELVRQTNSGVRILEFDGLGTEGLQTTTYLDRLAFNAATNTLTGRSATPIAGRDDEGPGRVSSILASASIGGDTPEDFFGNNTGGIEPETFIFADAGIPDNGDAIFDSGVESVDFIEWHTDQPFALVGFQLALSGDGAAPDRDTQLVRFLVEGVEVDLFDNDGFDGVITRFFSGGSATGDDFRMEFTRTTGQGPRLIDIDAILAVPEPATASLLLGANLFVLPRRRRQSLS